ncbi:hypothetical protein ACW9UR_14390 [Halovulum sp. GXIMD14794]
MEDTKKLAVAYGGFACVLEGFDNPFPLMRKVVRYYQDLSERDPDFAGYQDIENFEALREKLAEASGESALTLEPIAGGVHIRRFDPLPAAVPSVEPDVVAEEPAPEDTASTEPFTPDAPEHETHETAETEAPEPEVAEAEVAEVEVAEAGHSEPDVAEPEIIEPAAAETPEEHSAASEQHAVPSQPDAAEAEHTEPEHHEAPSETTGDHGAEHAESLHADAPQEQPTEDQPAPHMAEAAPSQEHETVSEDQPEAEPEMTAEAEPAHEPWHGDSMMFGDPAPAEEEAAREEPAEEEPKADEQAPAAAAAPDKSEPVAASNPAPEAAEPVPLPSEPADIAAALTEQPKELARATVETPLSPAPLRIENPAQPQEAAAATESPDAKPAAKPVAALRLGPELSVEGAKAEPEVPPTPSFIDTVEELPAPKGGLFRTKPSAASPEPTPAVTAEKDGKAAEAEDSGKRGGFRLGGLLRRKQADPAEKADTPDAPQPEPETAQKPAGGVLRLVEGGPAAAHPAATAEPAKPEALKPEPLKPEPLKPEPLKPAPLRPEPIADAEAPAAKADPLRALLSGGDAAPETEQPAKPAAAKPAQSAPAEASRKSDNSMKDRLHASYGGLPEPAPTEVRLEDGEADPSTPAGFARAVGATNLPDMMAAAAGYMTMIDGADRISRQQIMSMVQTIAGGGPISAEAKVKAFGKLVRSGQIIRGDAGSFFLSAEAAEEFQAKLNELV